MDPFFSCRKASKARPLQGAASGSTADVGPAAVGGGGEAGLVTAAMSEVGCIVTVAMMGVVAASVTSSVSSKVSPRATEGGEFGHMKNQQELSSLKHK